MSSSRQHSIQALRESIRENDGKLERLMQAYLDKVLSLSEYRDAKQQLVREKQDVKDQLTALENRHGSWFEPAIRFVKDVQYAGFLESSDDDEEKLTFAKKTGSNFRLVNRELICDPRDAWQLVVDTGSFAQHTTAPSCDDAVVAGETHQYHLKRRR